MTITDLERFLEEDIGSGDISGAVVPEVPVIAQIKADKPGYLAGLEEAKAVFEHFELKVESQFTDGSEIKKGDVVLKISGSSRSILAAERLALNFLGRMSGIASLTRECVKISKGVKIAGTRKTTPGFRKYEKKAIAIGGGNTHRFALSDAILIKDNHIQIAGLENAVRNAKKIYPTKEIEIEVDNVNDAIKVARLGVDIIMFDNMNPEDIREAVEKLKKAKLRKLVRLEASGGINLENISEFASTGVNIMSLGVLTHSAPWVSFSLDIIS
ncbi:MAG: carboxylating nicotinate-nucleotide diphosphorylase [Methanocellales archaeon]|nr:carboxylating nicotinate-nucleotide diphosphorylase [Methanocellales archaeon]MDD3291331.1 carboxylating nicotinate-nucleotide diphosphorylase [Methanocellales archaeon]MDD5235825.1 carboxylating nicotinate-nucleotide diphosphorylase [Methanocellales archaeon]MDD5484414.1 carboxylating nicotinate-nucleotide diphosphorylase [Methanocellales archaeon]